MKQIRKLKSSNDITSTSNSLNSLTVLSPSMVMTSSGTLISITPPSSSTINTNNSTNSSNSNNMSINSMSTINNSTKSPPSNRHSLNGRLQLSHSLSLASISPHRKETSNSAGKLPGLNTSPPSSSTIGSRSSGSHHRTPSLGGDLSEPILETIIKTTTLCNQIIKNREELEKQITSAKAYLTNRLEQQPNKDLQADIKKSLVACLKIERRLKKIVKLSEVFNKSDDPAIDGRSLAIASKKLLKRVPAVKKLCVTFSIDTQIFEKLAVMWKNNTNSVSNSPSPTPRSPKEKKRSSSPLSQYRKSMGESRGSLDSLHSEFAIPIFTSTPPPPPPPPKTEVTPASPPVFQKQLLQLEVKLKSADDKLLRKLLLSLATESSEALTKITSGLEDLKNNQPVKQTLFSKKKKWKGSLISKKSNTFTTSQDLKAELENVLGSHIPVIGAIPTPLQIPNRVVDGFLNVKFSSSSKWKKRWVVVDEENLYLFNGPDDTQQPKAVVSLFCASVRLREDKKYHFNVLTSEKTVNLAAESEKDTFHWTGVLEDVASNLIHKSIGSDHKNMKPIGSDGRSPSLQNLVLAEDNPSRKELLELLKVEGNGKCADCETIISEDSQQQWVSLNLGVFICLECSGAHRNLGVHLSKVRSCQYDDLEPEQLQFLRAMGNAKANNLFESNIPNNTAKPGPTDKLQSKHDWIKSKYEHLKFTTLSRDMIEQHITATAKLHQQKS